MKERKNKILFYCIIVITILSFIILGIISKKEIRNYEEEQLKIENNLELEEKEEKKINENYILNPNKVIDEYIFLTDTYDELKDIAIWYSEIDFHEFKIKAPDGVIYDISNKGVNGYDAKTKTVEFHFTDMKPGRWEIAYNEKSLDSNTENYGYKYLLPECSGVKNIENGILKFTTISEYGTYNYTYKIIANGTNNEGLYFANTLLEGNSKTNKEESIDISEFLKEYSEEEIIISVKVEVYKDIKEFFY